MNGQNWVLCQWTIAGPGERRLQPLVNNFDVSGSTNNARTLALVDAGDITAQSGDLGTYVRCEYDFGTGSRKQAADPGCFVDENYQVTYGSAL